VWEGGVRGTAGVLPPLGRGASRYLTVHHDASLLAYTLQRGLRFVLYSASSDVVAGADIFCFSFFRFNFAKKK
jgi:hypothetical protein